VGRRLAEVGFDLINGGHAGTMAAVSAGGRAGGARVLGVTCSPLRALRAAPLNADLHDVIAAPTLLARIEIMMRRASGYVILPAGTGTLAELAVVWDHVAKGLIAPRPIVFLAASWEPAIAAANAGAAANALLRRAADPEEVVRIISAEAVTLPEAERTYTAGLELRRADA